jgi:hypothetical protein
MNGRVLSTKGSQIQIVLEIQGQIFTPDNLLSVVNSNEFQISQGKISNPLNPASPPQNTQIYSKDSMMIYLLPSRSIFNNLIFTVLNSYDLKNEKIGDKSVSEFIKNIMDELSLVDENISSITFNFTTRFESTKQPEDQLTRLLQKNFMNKLKDATLSKSLKVMSIRIGDSFPIKKEGFNIVFEPLISKPDKVFFMQFTKKIIGRDSLFKLINSFPEILEELINGVDPND